MSRELMIVRTEELLSNPTNRVPIALCLDASASMSGKPMEELNQGVRLFFQALNADPIAKASAEVAIIAFSVKAQTVLDFQGLSGLETPPEMVCTGGGTKVDPKCWTKNGVS